MNGEGGMDGIFYFCDNALCYRYGLYVSQNIKKNLVTVPKRIVFMNTSIITSIGTFTYDIETLEYLQNFIISNPGIEKISAIGHQSTSDILTELFGFSIPLNRIQYKQEVGDYCIVFKLNGRPEEGKILTREEVEKIGYEFYVLEKIK